MNTRCRETDEAVVMKRSDRTLRSDHQHCQPATRQDHCARTALLSMPHKSPTYGALQREKHGGGGLLEPSVVTLRPADEHFVLYNAGALKDSGGRNDVYQPAGSRDVLRTPEVGEQEPGDLR
ncbi:hypothetical protein SKAU_G00074620 [Synaphobranchus kaupii]|uniref:Uncharacterized protein n=1 Tax=Synaphobranchus kaupii TaxID=118154 RepID=A0A9Q1G7F9_SYNKA|nr:hypothetical protein SKAU_G00074620 [Synaphobranchus kaupii]